MKLRPQEKAKEATDHSTRGHWNEMNRKQGRDKKGISGVITVLRPSAKLIVGPTSIRLDGPSS